MTTSVVENRVLFSMVLLPDLNLSTSGVGIRTIPVYFVHQQSADLQLSEGSKLIAYADDLLLYKPVDSNADYNRVQEDLTTIDHWMSHNFLMLNTTQV